MRPDGAMYGVTKVVRKIARDGDPRDDEFRVYTSQKRTFLLLYPELPVLVKRDIPCGWPRCELHCGKCINYREEEDRRAEMLQSANAVNPQKAKEREEKHQHKVTPIRRRESKQRSIPSKEREYSVNSVPSSPIEDKVY